MHFLVPTTFKLILFLPLLFFFQSSTGDHVTDSCADSASYTSGSKFGSNLNELLRSLVANGPRDGFYNTTVGLEPDRVYGLVQCRGDISTDICASCLNTSSSEIVQRCPNKRAGYMRYGYDKYGYDYCLLRYSNQSFFSVLSFESFYWSFNGYNVSDAIRFNQVMKGLMGNLSNQADPAKDMFAAGEVRFTDAQNISGMVQCTGDLSKSDCRRCVQLALPTVQSCCDGLPDVQLFNPSCIMRFDVVSALQVSPPAGKKRNTLIIVLAIVISIVTALVLLFTIRGCILKRKVDKNISVGQDISKGKSLLFELQTIKVATNNFSEENIVGSGGFGIVYRGMLLNGQEIAVKRLSRGSTQGVEEFMTEVVLVAKLEHRSLVSLLGCCLEGEEKLLIYEYVPNKSLNNFLFDPVKRLQLDWQTRYKIIGGIARGLLYLHEESRLKIIHRDLKASNILLDTDMNPKISDFGMARLFGGEQTQADTSKIAGTYGYMSPEYILHGRYSAKSDVFSFGVLVLEIVAGQKSSGFYESEQAEDLLSYTWKHWREGTALELVDQSLGEDYPRSELLKCIHIGLLCVQEDAVDRPTMSSVVLILSSDSPTLQAPLPPAFFWRSIRQNALNRVPNSTFSKPMTLSENEMSITELDPH